MYQISEKWIKNKTYSIIFIADLRDLQREIVNKRLKNHWLKKLLNLNNEKIGQELHKEKYNINTGSNLLDLSWHLWNNQWKYNKKKEERRTFYKNMSRDLRQGHWVNLMSIECTVHWWNIMYNNLDIWHIFHAHRVWCRNQAYQITTNCLSTAVLSFDKLY